MLVEKKVGQLGDMTDDQMVVDWVDYWERL